MHGLSSYITVIFTDGIEPASSPTEWLLQSLHFLVLNGYHVFWMKLKFGHDECYQGISIPSSWYSWPNVKQSFCTWFHTAGNKYTNTHIWQSSSDKMLTFSVWYHFINYCSRQEQEVSWATVLIDGKVEAQRTYMKKRDLQWYCIFKADDSKFHPPFVWSRSKSSPLSINGRGVVSSRMPSTSKALWSCADERPNAGLWLTYTVEKNWKQLQCPVLLDKAGRIREKYYGDSGINRWSSYGHMILMLLGFRGRGDMMMTMMTKILINIPLCHSVTCSPDVLYVPIFHWPHYVSTNPPIIHPPLPHHEQLNQWFYYIVKTRDDWNCINTAATSLSSCESAIHSKHQLVKKSHTNERMQMVTLEYQIFT